MATRFGFSPGRTAALGCAVLLAVLVLLAHPFAEIGMIDDWSYAYTAKVLAEAGRVVYNGWATAILTWMLYWAALFIRLFGFSFFAVRCSMLVVSMATVFVVHRLLRRSGLSETHSTVGTLAVMLSPPFFNLCFLYMSDVPGMFALVVCFYAVVRALTAETKNAVTGWLVFASVSNLLIGSVRQIALLGVLAIVPCAALRLRRRVRFFMLVPVWLACVGCVAGLMLWFRAQPYSVMEPLIPGKDIWQRLDMLLRVPAAHMFFLAPLLVLFPAALRWRDRRVRIAGGVFAGMLVLLFILLRRSGEGSPLLIPYMLDTLSYVGFHNLATPMGDAPVLLGLGVRAALSCLTFLLLCGLVVYVAAPSLRWQGGVPVKGQVRPDYLVHVFAPFVLIYFVLFVTRFIPFDRYLIPLTPLMAMAALYMLERTTGNRGISVWTALLALFLAVFDVTMLHDEFALYRARAEVAKELVAAGVPRTHILGGFEYDGWTEIEATGYIKDPKLKLKAGQQGFDRELSWDPFPTLFFFRGYTPTVQPDYVITHTLLPEVERTGLPDVVYHTWTRPGTWPLIAARVRPQGSR